MLGHWVRVRDLEHIALGSVDHGGLAAGAHARQLCIIVQVHMAVHEPLRLVFIHQIIEARKALVSMIRAVVQDDEWVSSRSMPPT